MHRTTNTAITLAVALLVAATVSTGALTAAGAHEPSLASTSAEVPSATTASEPVEPLLQSSEEPLAAPEPQPTQLEPAQTAEAEPAAASSTSTTVSAPSAPRPQPTSQPAPLAAQPAPLVSASPNPTVPACAPAISGTTSGAPSRTSPLGVAGTTSADLQSFAVAYNAIRVANCLAPVPFANIRYDSCMEDRLFWIAEDPSTDPLSAWGHLGSQRSDGLPSVGCDGNLAGGLSNDGAIVAQKWWDSSGHRTSLYKSTYTGSTAKVCILFAMTHGGVPDEPYSFTRSAARWADC